MARRRGAGSGPGPKSRAAVERDWRARTDELETAYREAAMQLFAAETDEVIALVEQAARGTAAEIQATLRQIERAYTEDDGTYHERWAEAVEQLNQVTLDIAGRDLRAQTGLQILLGENPEAREAMFRRAERLADLVGQTTSDRVVASVEEAIRNGGGVADIVRSLTDDGPLSDAVSEARATMIARTELVGALNEGAFVRALESNLFIEKEWMHSGNSNNPRDWHVQMDGERVPIDEPFSNGLMHPGEAGAPPEEVINCGCTCLFHE